MKHKYGLFIFFIIIIISFVLPNFQVFGQVRTPGTEKEVNSDKNRTGIIVEDLSGTLTAYDMANSLVGSGVTIQNVTFTGANDSSGIFSGGSDSVGFDSGVILTTGSVHNVVGPNVSDGISRNNLLPGDAGLNELSEHETYDAAILEFDFIPDDNQISFQFVFSSDEYNEYVHSTFNDVFGFFVNGVNHALIEGSPISVNTINNGNPYGSTPNSNPGFFINNDLNDGGGSLDIEMDGLTVVLTCSSPVNPGQVNHMKLAIADASDHILDSAIFIRGTSITTERRPVIIIPGMTASINYSCLAFELNCNDDSKWDWTPTADSHYDRLINRLAQLDYSEENGYLNIFLYDWRKPISTHVTKLKNRIEEVKAETGSEKVDLIGHSMGGLVARAYVQSDTYYGNDVEHLITLGSPHLGSAKSYPMWQAFQFYEMELKEIAAISFLMEIWKVQYPFTSEVMILREKVPSLKQLLPTFEYLYDDSSHNLLPEAGLIHRNTYIHNLNANIDVLSQRTQVAAFNGSGLLTTEKFYVNPPNLFYQVLGLWDDGRPDFSYPVLDYKAYTGDNTVLALSAKLPSPATVKVFSNLEHGDIPDSSEVINEICAFLDLSPQSQIIEAHDPTFLMFLLAGSADAVITDPLGRVLSQNSVSAAGLSNDYQGSELLESEIIPDATYYFVEGQPHKLITIVDPIDGKYEIDILGNASGEFELGLFDSFNEPPNLIEDAYSQLWDTTSSTTGQGSSTVFTFQYAKETTPDVNLIAETPVIEIPVFWGNIQVTGRAVPGKLVKIYDFQTNALLGSGTANQDGHYEILLAKPLTLEQSIYPVCDNISGFPVCAEIGVFMFVPLMSK